MTETYDPTRHFAEMELPAQDLGKLAFCGGSRVTHVQKWADRLQATRITQTSAQLYQSLPEISRLKTDPKTRLEMLEVLRPHVHNTIAGLVRDVLGQPLILPEPAQRAAILAQALQKGLITGYSLCVRDLVHQRTINTQARATLSQVVYRTVFSVGRLYLRNCQIYTQLPKGLWLHLHELFRLAEHFEILTTPVDDPLLQWSKQGTIRDAYVRVATLACSKPNQLGQQELELVFQALEAWAAKVDLHEEVDPENANPFVINLSRDAPPVYKTLFDGHESDHLLELDFQYLARALQFPQSTSARDLPMLTSVPSPVKNRLVAAWEGPSNRQQHRQKASTVVDVCVGLTECHYHLAGAVPFAAFARSGDGSLGQEQDLLEAVQQCTSGDGSSSTATPAHALSRVTVQNVSAGGYCLYWKEAMPQQVSSGQLIGIREPGQQGWLLGVICWVKQLRGASQTGVQVLGLDAKPAAASIIYDMGGYSDSMRVFQLPSDTAGTKPATLVTSAPFQAHHRIRLHDGEQRLLVKLGECILSTGQMRRFCFEILGSEPTNGAAKKTFDSDWD